VPIWVGGSSRPALQRVVEFGNVWHPLGFTVMDEGYKAANAAELAGKTLPTSGTTPDRLRRDLDYLKGLADEAGRDLSDLQVVVLPGPPVDEEDTSLAASVEKTLRLTEGGDRAVDWLGRYVDAGATGFVVAPPGESLYECAEHLRRYAAEVIPLLNRHARSGVQAEPG